MTQKRVVAIHDISCFGKCSLTVALPILSAGGIETSVIPTAVLSTHTGGFTGFTYRDLTDDILPIVNHWETLNIHFDAIYTGFLGSFEQIDIVCEACERLRSEQTLIYVDPVMADQGQLYSIFPKEFPKGMRRLVEQADFLVPNITEATLLLDKPYREGPYEIAYIEELLHELAGLGPKRIVLTGVYFEKGLLGAATYDHGEIKCVFEAEIPGHFHGTGDVFGSALLAGLLQDHSIEEATKIAVQFTTGAIERTRIAGTEARNGVDFEEEIPNLLKNLKLT